MTYWSVSYNPNAGKHNAELRAERQKSEQTMKDSIEVSRKKREEQAKKIEEKQTERRAEEKDRMELMLAEGKNVDEIIAAIQNGETKAFSEIATGGIDVGNRVNLTV